jgi:hypothetical protein
LLLVNWYVADWSPVTGLWGTWTLSAQPRLPIFRQLRSASCQDCCFATGYLSGKVTLDK